MLLMFSQYFLKNTEKYGQVHSIVKKVWEIFFSNKESLNNAQTT